MNVARLRFVRTPAGVVGCVLLAAVVAVALFGPLFAPYAPDEPVGVPFSGPAEGTPVGTVKRRLFDALEQLRQRLVEDPS